MEKLYTVEDVAEFAGLTTRTIRAYLADGRLRGRKIGSQWRFTESDIEALFDAADAKPASDINEVSAVLDFLRPQKRDAAAIFAVIDYPAASREAGEQLAAIVRAQAETLDGGETTVDGSFDAENMIERFTLSGALENVSKLIKTIRRS